MGLIVDIESFWTEDYAGQIPLDLVSNHYEKKLTKNIRPTDILQIYTSI